MESMKMGVEPVLAEAEVVKLAREFADVSSALDSMRGQQRELDERQAQAAKHREQLKSRLMSIVGPEYLPTTAEPAEAGWDR